MEANMQSRTLATSGEPLRIAFFTDFYTPQVNGVAVSLRLLADSLRAAGHEVTIFAPRVGRYHDTEAGVVRLPSVRVMRQPPVYAIVPGTPGATRRLGRARFDIVHVHTPMTAGALAYLLARQKHVPLIYTYHTAITEYTHYVGVVGRTRLARRAAGRFSALGCNLSDYIVAPSAKMERALREQQVRQPIHVIPSGIDLERFACPVEARAWRRRLGLSPDAPLLVYVGRLDLEKSLDFLIEAFAAIVRRVPGSHLVFAGDGQARPGLERQAAATGLGEYIHFLGMVNRAEVPGLLHEADLFVSASTSETQCLAVVEAIACGLPVVAVDDEALRASVAEGVNGRLTPREVEPFAQAVADLLADPARRQAFGRASREKSRKFSVEAQAAAIVQVYRDAIEGRRAGSNETAPIRWHRQRQRRIR
jgi:1,2-diacylglycerol 3-alpha-glucosyltransferase